MDIIKIKNFHDFVETGCNYAVSAKNCALSITGLRRQITSLEDEISVKLLHTEGKKILLTKEGMVFYEQTKNLIFEYNKTLSSLHKRRYSDKIVISTSNAIASLWLCDYINDFRHENMDIEINVIAADKKPDLIKDNIDIYIGMEIEDEEGYLIQERITHYNMGLYAHKSYLGKYGYPQIADDLQKHKIITFGDADTPPYTNIDWHLDLTKKQIKNSFSINTGAGVLRAVELGFGIGVVSSLAVSLSQEDLVRVLPQIEGRKIDVFFTYPSYLDDELIRKLKNSLDLELRLKKRTNKSA